MPEQRDFTDLTKEELLQIVHLMFGNILTHYGMWFTQTTLKHGGESALKIESRVFPPYFKIMTKRLAPHLGLKMEGDALEVLANKDSAALIELIHDMTKVWLAGDGIWFQGVEKEYDMQSAKNVNDACWFDFAPYEAYRLKKLVGEDGGPMETLAAALKLRPYSALNGCAIEKEAPNVLTFEMLNCRVQSARRRKNMEDYPCKTGGFVEHSRFAYQIDPRLKTDCVRCPPDPMTTDQFCKWRFTLEG